MGVGALDDVDADWRMRVLGDQLGDVKKAMNDLRRKLPER